MSLRVPRRRFGQRPAFSFSASYRQSNWGPTHPCNTDRICVESIGCFAKVRAESGFDNTTDKQLKKLFILCMTLLTSIPAWSTFCRHWPHKTRRLPTHTHTHSHTHKQPQPPDRSGVCLMRKTTTRVEERFPPPPPPALPTQFVRLQVRSLGKRLPHAGIESATNRLKVERST